MTSATHCRTSVPESGGPAAGDRLLRPWITVGVALAGAGVIAVTPVTAPLPDVRVPDIALTAGDDEPITLDFLRHAESTDNTDNKLETTPPGPELTEHGQQQAQDIANELAQQNIHGLYASELIRDQQTLGPLAEMLGVDVHTLSGLNDIPGGILDGLVVNGSLLNQLTGALYFLGPLAWTLGLYFVPELGDPSFNGAEFEDRFSDALQTIHNESDVSGDGNITDVASASELAITVGTLMNVDNPDLPLILKHVLETGDFLSNEGMAVVKGDPEDGWTLVSFDGQDVPQDPGLATELFVDFRDLITAPQMAAYHIFEAIQGGGSTTIEDAIQTGLQSVGAAIVQFPQSVINDLLDAI
jgi:broad specificity phosphatase PhoE